MSTQPFIPIIRPVFDAAEEQAVAACLASGHVAQGPRVAEFESRFAARHQVAHGVAVSSCTTALHLAVAALGIGPGDEVLVPALTWVATANAVEYVGARPVFVDVDPNTFNLDPAKLEQAVTERTKAIMAVHLFGLCAEMDAVNAVAREHGLHVIEDAACAAGASYRGVSAGALGALGCFSFHPRKVITTGEGGMITTNNEELANRCRVLRNHGMKPLPAGSGGEAWRMPEIASLGYNYRMTDLQGAVGCAQMDKFDAILAERARLAGVYSELLAGRDDLALPGAPEHSAHSWQSYVVRLRDGDMTRRNRIMDGLTAGGIQSRPGTHSVPRLAYYASKYGLTTGAYPNAALCEDATITLPLVHGMSPDQQQRVTSLLS